MNISTTEKYGKGFGKPSWDNWDNGPKKNSTVIKPNNMTLLNKAISKKGLTGGLPEEIIEIAKKK